MNIKSNHTARFIKDKRQELKLTLKEISEIVGWGTKNQQYASNICLGKAQLPAKYIRRMALILRTTESEIIAHMTLDYNESLRNEIAKGQWDKAKCKDIAVYRKLVNTIESAEKNIEVSKEMLKGLV